MDIKKEILKLKRNYKQSTNIYDISDNNIKIENFQIKINLANKQVWDKIKIIDTKEYIKKNQVLNIDNFGFMEAYSIKILKYINISKYRINLYSKKKIRNDAFEGSTDYDKMYKQKQIVFEKNNIKLIFYLKTDNNKETKYSIKIIFKEIEINDLDFFINLIF